MKNACEPIRIGMIDPCPMTLAGCEALAAKHSMTFVMSAGDGRDGFRALLDKQPDVVLSEIDLQYRSIFDVIGDLRQREIKTSYILLRVNWLRLSWPWSLMMAAIRFRSACV